MSSTTALEITKRASQTLRPNYFAIRERIRRSGIVNIDETSLKVDGKKYWIWAFVTKTDTFYVVRKSRGKQVLEEVLGTDFLGFVGCDGWGPILLLLRKFSGVGLICFGRQGRCLSIIGK